MLRSVFATMLLAYIVIFSGPVVVAQQTRYAQCDACGLCKDTMRTKYCETSNTTTPAPDYRAATGCTNDAIYVQPQSWSDCAKCLYPYMYVTPPPSGSIIPKVPCGQDMSGPPGRDIVFVGMTNGRDVVIDPAESKMRCNTIIIDVTPSSPRFNLPTLAPQTGRMFSDLGCTGVGTRGGTFTDPNASVDVVGVLLRMVMGFTGATGMVFIIINAVRLLTSQGNPEKILFAKKSLTNTIVGLVFALFGLFIFRFLAIQMLRIPGIN